MARACVAAARPRFLLALRGTPAAGAACFPPTMPRRFRALIVALTLALATLGAPALAQDARELTEEARKQYAQQLKVAAAMVKEKQYADAMVKLDALLAERPREPQARFLKAVVEADSGKRDAAMATLRALIEDYPELPEPYNNLAVLHAQRGEYESARVALEIAIRTAPDWAVAHENLGDIYARLAAAEYDRAAKLDRDNKTAPVKLGMARDLFTRVGAAGTKQ